MLRRLVFLCLLTSCAARETPLAPVASAQAPPTPVPSMPPPMPSVAAPLPSSSPQPSPPPVPDGMLLVPGGTFRMGADSGGEQDEHPAHAVTLAPFYLDRTEVTQRAYGECVATAKCRASASPEPRPEHPVRYVSWQDAQTYCAWRGKRLPREAEFERAVRGDDGRLYPWGSASPNTGLTVCSGPGPLAVGSRPSGRGPYGHDDLAGNVWEWMDDLYDPIAYRRPTADAGEPGSCDAILQVQHELRHDGKQGFTGSNPIPTECERSIRGGAYNFGGAGLRATNRIHHPANYRISVLGFRCAASLAL
ncbi:MAG: SUMF1/EgtB/PvdO family nonheme iron enzyme [Myxococcales bacterium]